MKNKKYLTFGTVPESNIKIVEKCKMDIPDKQIHEVSKLRNNYR
jgi:hypothetical protein